jgi:hypothetical protein
MVEFEDILHTVFYFNDDIYLHCVLVYNIYRFFNVHHIHKVLQETVLI